jgi:hypothetical protein
MTDDTRGAIGDLAVVALVALGVYVVARNRPLRRAVWQLTRHALFTAVPQLLLQETAHAWAMSATPSSLPRSTVRDLDSSR